MFAAQIVAFSLSATICFLSVRSCSSGWKILLVAITGFATSLVAGVGFGALFFKPDPVVLAHLITNAFWFSLFGVIVGSIYDSHQRRKNVQ